MSAPSGRRIAIDFGQIRSGIAVSDQSGLIASPLETIQTEVLIERIQSLAEEANVYAIYVGLPAHLSGAEGSSAKKVREFAAVLSKLALAPVYLVDERLSTKSSSSEKGLIEKYGIDAVAATQILELALAGERASGKRFGELVDE